ncbi:MAG: adenylate kinase [Ilumatobacteraceae bacterium]
MVRVLLLAPPGAGKGTQGSLLSHRFGIPHLATGDLFRHHIADATPVGVEAKAYVDVGKLVPDDLVTDLVITTLDTHPPMEGFILDGFPRTLAQARVAYEWARSTGRTFTAVIMLEVPDGELVSRLVERGRQSGRSDDSLEVIHHRLRVYATHTAPLIEFYEARGILHRVDGTGTISVVAQRINHELTQSGLEGSP